jgi:hypothetical protein
MLQEMQMMRHRLQKRSDRNQAAHADEYQHPVRTDIMMLGNAHRLSHCALYFSERGKDLVVPTLEKSLENDHD